jgi:hypothetical protein
VRWGTSGAKAPTSGDLLRRPEGLLHPGGSEWPRETYSLHPALWFSRLPAAEMAGHLESALRAWNSGGYWNLCEGEHAVKTAGATVEGS